MSLRNKSADIRNDIFQAKKKANIYIQEEVLARYRPEPPQMNSENNDEHFDCTENCECMDVKADVENLGTNFPVLVVTPIEEFMEKAEKRTAGRSWEKKVQLVLTNPYTRVDDQPTLKYEHIRKIVQYCNSMVKSGGHLFVKTTSEHLQIMTNAFKSVKGPAEQVVFTVDEAP